MGAAASVGDVCAALDAERARSVDDVSMYETADAAMAEVARIRTLLRELSEWRGVSARSGASGDSSGGGASESPRDGGGGGGAGSLRRDRTSSKAEDAGDERGCDLVFAMRDALSTEVELPLDASDVDGDVDAAKAEIVRLRGRMRTLWVREQLRVRDTSPKRHLARETQW